jgi:DNA-binding PadR family transcriptional regulator
MGISRPIKPAVFHILLALAGGDSYGYAIMQAVREQSRGLVPLQTGSFYRHLAWLLESKLVTETASPRTADPRRGAYYRITALGRRAVAAEQLRLRELLSTVESLAPMERKGSA